MKLFVSIFLALILASTAFAQNEQAPMGEKALSYKDWTYKSVRDDKDLNLRKAAAGKKLVIVVYWAPWCPNWKYDAPFVQGLYDKYKANGLEVIGVAEYDTIEKMKAHIADQKLTFPIVYESTASADREKTTHFALRREAGDARKWGSPWYVFLDPAALEPQGEVLTKKTQIVNGELIKPDAEKYIRQRLGLEGAAAGATASSSKDIEVCEPEKKSAEFKKP
jgi:thiol-disulfide isomerase/thioredoxin